jgi:rhodanese-related sulfurtransferase
MRKIFLIFCLIGVASFSTSCVDAKADSSDIKLVTAQEMKAILELEDVQLVDVRTPEEYNTRHIENAQNIDFRSATFDEDITKLDKTKPVVLYCKSGGRSAKCVQKMKEAGFEKIYELKGGISKWEHPDDINLEKKS